MLRERSRYSGNATSFYLSAPLRVTSSSPFLAFGLNSALELPPPEIRRRRGVEKYLRIFAIVRSSVMCYLEVWPLREGHLTTKGDNMSDSSFLTLVIIAGGAAIMAFFWFITQLGQVTLLSLPF